jgi:hypothetical protein
MVLHGLTFLIQIALVIRVFRTGLVEAATAMDRRSAGIGKPHQDRPAQPRNREDCRSPSHGDLRQR